MGELEEDEDGQITGEQLAGGLFKREKSECKLL